MNDTSGSDGTNLWSSTAHAVSYLGRAREIPRRVEGETALIECLPLVVRRGLDLGTGDGHLLALVLAARPDADGVALDFSPAMLDRSRARFAENRRVRIVEHNLDDPLPPMGRFDAVVSCFAIHHLSHRRKHALYEEVFEMLEPGGVFCNLEHVASPTVRLHEQFLAALGVAPAGEDPSNKLLDVHTQVEWLRALGFEDADCHWKWRELALLAGVKPADVGLNAPG
jgi:cyclopropane fatty-acyl-phospholipid synthase-like methyltransferase